VAILDLVNCSQPPTDTANCLTLQNALDNKDEKLMFLKTSIRMISRPTYAKYVKTFRAFYTSTNVVKFGNQVPMCDDCNKCRHIFQACRNKVAEQKNRAKQQGGKGGNNGEKGRNDRKFARINEMIPQIILTKILSKPE
jgi:lysine/ornithine N-monooxygenase